MLNSKIYVGIGIVIVIALAGIVLSNNDQEPVITRDLGLNFTYSDMNSKLKQDLLIHNMSLSSPVKIQEKKSLEKYCNFFEDEQKQNLIEYCTSTELKDPNGKFLGNIHMVGSPSSPKLVMSVIQTDPFMNQINEIKTTYELVIGSVVCDCWEEFSPDGFSSVSDWVDGLREFHLSGAKPHSKSKVIELDGKSIQIELTTNQDGYLWKLLIAK